MSTYGWRDITSGQAGRSQAVDAANAGRSGCSLSVCFPRSTFVYGVDRDWIVTRVQIEGQREETFGANRGAAQPRFVDLAPGTYRVGVGIDNDPGNVPGLVTTVEVGVGSVYAVIVQPRWYRSSIIRRSWFGPSLTVEAVARAR